MDRKIREKITNVFENIFKIFWNWMDAAQKETGSRSAQNKIQTILYWPGLSPTAWMGLMIQPRMVTVPMHSNQSIIIRRLLCSCTVTG